MTDPVFQDDTQTQNNQDNQQNPVNQENQNNQNDGIFGGSTDIFENEDMFQAVEKDVKSEEISEEEKFSPEIETETENTTETTAQEETPEESFTPVENLEPIPEIEETSQENVIPAEAGIQDTNTFTPEIEESNQNTEAEISENSNEENATPFPSSEETKEDKSPLTPLYQEGDDSEMEEGVSPLTKGEVKEGFDKEETETVEEESNDIFGGENLESEAIGEEIPNTETEEENNEESSEKITENPLEQLDEIPEFNEEENLTIPVAAAVASQTEQEENISEQKEENKDEEKLEQKVEEKKETKDTNKTELQKSFYTLLFTIKDVYKLKNLENGESFELKQGENTYQVNLGFNALTFTKEGNTLNFQIEGKPTEKNLLVNINGETLYNEEKDLKDNQKNMVKVQEKFKKFTLLVEEEKEKLQKEQKDEKLKGVFRDF